MQARTRPWDYLIVTASNERQAAAYQAQLDVRRELGLLSDVREVLVVADPGGRRIGSGGSTLYCLMEVLSRRLHESPAVARASRPCSSVARASDPCPPAEMGTARLGEARPGRPRDARAGRPRHAEAEIVAWERVLRELRILIVHAGGDSRRLPAYSACGKLFIPVPGENDTAVCLSLFDRQLPTYLALPEPTQGRGQVVITSGDVLLRFDPAQVRFARQGVTGLACYAHPQQASRHGVFCCGRDDAVRLYLQKPSIAAQRDQGAIDAYGQSCLDIGVMHFDAATAVRLLRLFGARPGPGGRLAFAGPRGRAVLERGLDFYREICCAMGRESSPEHHIRSAHESGSKWTAAMLGGLFRSLAAIPFNVQLLKHCEFLDFGMNRSLIASGARLLQEDQGLSHLHTFLDVNNDLAAGGAIQGSAGWVEGCRIHAPLTMKGHNVVVGIDVEEPLTLPPGACLDVIRGREPTKEDCGLQIADCGLAAGADSDPQSEIRNPKSGLVQNRATVWTGGSGKAGGFAQALPMAQRQDHRQAPKTPLAAATHPCYPGRPVFEPGPQSTVWFVRCYGVDDAFKEPAGAGAIFCGMPLPAWLKAVGAQVREIWGADVGEKDRTIWNAWLFPAVREQGEYRQWLWMFDPAGASDDQRRTWRSARRYSLEQILALADHQDFYERRQAIRAEVVRNSLHRVFRPESGLSARELSALMRRTASPAAWVAETLQHACRYCEGRQERGTASLVLPRIVHTLGSALTDLDLDGHASAMKALHGLAEILDPASLRRLSSLGVAPAGRVTMSQWCRQLQQVAFQDLEQAIVASGVQEGAVPHSVLRSDEIVWARAPARLDLGGGWTDTPPYSLEWGGCVTNAAVDLNGQPPIQAYVRVIDEPVVRIGSIDLGVRIEVRKFDDLMDYRQATGSFALAKAALALCGLAPDRRRGRTSLKKALAAFGGGIELTTLAAIPKGSGLGTSSIMGAVIVAALGRVMGRQLTQRELFHSVLRLEQALTTGGGWQDQIGGVVDGVKMIVTEPGMVPDAHIHYLPSDILDPRANGGRTLLYYTGITRLAKNILQQVVGRYLNRDREAMTTLRHIGSLARDVMDTFIRKDIEQFGYLMDVAWQLNKRLDPNSSNDEIEALFARVQPYIYGGKLLGAGGGGFMLMVCKSPDDAAAVRTLLETEPPNARARFFDFRISTEGLVVTVC